MAAPSRLSARLGVEGSTAAGPLAAGGAECQQQLWLHSTFGLCLTLPFSVLCLLFALCLTSANAACYAEVYCFPCNAYSAALTVASDGATISSMCDLRACRG